MSRASGNFFFFSSGIFKPAIKKIALEKLFAINYDAVGGSAPATMASPDCDCAVLPVRNRGEISI
jgi:hypothetical protein